MSRFFGKKLIYVAILLGSTLGSCGAISVAHAQIDPNRLIIPAIKVNALIEPMGLTTENKMAVPNNYTTVGWYSLGAAPGDIGSAVIGAHVDNGGKISGVFKNLKYLRKGNLVYVKSDAGGYLVFKVVDRKIYSYQTKGTEAVFAKDDKARLNLITCYGTWLPKKNTYDRRLVVFTEFVGITS